jgi:hypothetical protein
MFLTPILTIKIVDLSINKFYLLKVVLLGCFFILKMSKKLDKKLEKIFDFVLDFECFLRSFMSLQDV